MSLTTYTSGLQCDVCKHEQVCRYKEDYADAYNEIQKLTINKHYGNSCIGDIVVPCRYFEETPTLTRTITWDTTPVPCNRLGTIGAYPKEYARGITTCPD